VGPIETPIVWPAQPGPNAGPLPFFVTTGLLIGIAGAAPHVIAIERGLDRVVRLVAPALVVAEIAMFAVAIAHAKRPDPDTFIATLPEPRPLGLGEHTTIGGKELYYVQESAHRDACQVLDEQLASYTSSYDGCDPATVTVDDVTGMVMVHRSSSWSSPTALRPRDIAKRLAAPVGWTHLAGGGALLAAVGLLIATAFARRARAIEAPELAAPGGYRVPAPMPADEDPEARRRDVYEARARGARLVALTIAASTGLPLAAAMAHGLGR
jgi:hypothetical protein